MIRQLFLTLMLAVAVWCGLPALAEVPDDPDAVCPLLPGMQAPSFTARQADGSPYHFDASALEVPVVLSFYRGGWCPYCNVYLASMRHAEPRLVEMGFEVIFVSADRPEVLYESLEHPDIGYRLLSDAPMAVAEAFGVAFRVDPETVERYRDYGIDLEAAAGLAHHRLPVPSVFVIGRDGVIRFQYANPNYKVRLDPELLLKAAELALDRPGRD